MPFPIAEFSYTSVFACDSTKLIFTNTSIDGDVYRWSFGNGDTSNLKNPQYAYRLPGTYIVSLYAKDIATNKDSVISSTVIIKGHTASAISDVVCNSYTSPSGKI